MKHLDFLRTFVLMLCIAAFGFAGCTKDTTDPDPKPEPKPTVEVPTITVGEAVFNQTNDKASVTVTPSENAEAWYWRLSADGAAAEYTKEEGGAKTLEFDLVADVAYVLTAYAENSAGKSDEATCEWKWTAPEEVDAFEIVIKDVTASAVTFDVNAADDEMRYVFMCVDKAYADQFPDDESLYQDDILYFEEYLDYGYATIAEVIEAFTTFGDYADLVQDGLDPETEYLLYVYGLELDGTRTTDIYREYVTTKAIEKQDVSFDIAATVDGSTIDVTITPSNNDIYYYFDCIAQESVDFDFGGDITATAQYFIDYNVDMGTYYGMTVEEVIAEIASQGVDQYLFECSPNTEYIIFAMAVSTDGNIISEVAHKNVATGEVEPSDNVITMTVDAKTSTTVTVSTTTTNEDPYYLGIEPAALYAGMTDEQIMEEIIAYYGEYIYYSTEYGNVEALELTDLNPGTEYLLMAFGIEGGTPTTALVKQSVTTDAGNDPALCTFDIEVGEITSTTVAATVTPSVDDVRYFWNIVEAGQTDDEIMAAINADINKWVESGDVANAYEYWQMISYTGVDSWTYGYLEPNTEYEIYAMPIDMNTCDKAAPLTRVAVTTLDGAATMSVGKSAEPRKMEVRRTAASVTHRAELKAPKSVAPMRPVEKSDNRSSRARVAVRHSVFGGM